MYFYYNFYLFLIFLFLLPKPFSKKLDNFLWITLFIIFVIIIGFRYDVSGDWQIYRDNFYNIAERGLFHPLDIKVQIRSDYLYELLSWIVYSLDLEYYFVTLFCSFIFTFGLFKFSKFTGNQYLCLIISCPYLVYVIGMGYTRQSVAIGFIMIGITALINKKNNLYFIYIILGILFHKISAIMISLIYLFDIKKILSTKYLIFPVIFILVIYLISNDFTYLLYYLSDNNNVKSSGAFFRFLLQFIPSIIFLFFSNKLSNNLREKRIFQFFSIFSILCIYPIIYYSTAGDRLLLYFIPLQLFVFSRFSLLFENNLHKIFFNFLIIFYYFTQLLFWFNFSVTSYAWIPYDNYLF